MTPDEMEEHVRALLAVPRPLSAAQRARLRVLLVQLAREAVAASGMCPECGQPGQHLVSPFSGDLGLWMCTARPARLG